VPSSPNTYAATTPPSGSNYCPQWDEKTFPSVANKPLPAGRYLVEMKPYNKGDMEVFAYRLKLDLVKIPPP
jgi:hypothetical protein